MLLLTIFREQIANFYASEDMQLEGLLQKLIPLAGIIMACMMGS
jgi:hypothetical protein